MIKSHNDKKNAMKKILFTLCVIFSLNSFSQDRNDEARKKLSLSLDGQSEKLSSGVVGWSKMENKDGKFWKEAPSGERGSYLPCCKDDSEFEYFQTFKFTLEGETFYLMAIKYSESTLRTFAFTSKSLRNLVGIINATENQPYNVPAIEYCEYYNKSVYDKVFPFDIEKAIQNKEMIRLLLTGQGSSILSNDCKGNSIFKLSSQVLKGDTIIRFNNLPWQNSLRGTLPLTDNYFEVKKSDFMKLFNFNPYLSEKGSNKLGNDKLASGDYKGAIDAFDACIKINPNGFDYYTSRGRAKAGLKQYDAAITDYSIALGKLDLSYGPNQGKNESNASWIHSFISYAKSELHDSIGAVNELKESVKLSSIEDKGYFYNTLGEYYFSKAEFMNALCYFTSAISSEQSRMGKAKYYGSRAYAIFNLPKEENEIKQLKEIYRRSSQELKVFSLDEFSFGFSGVIMECDKAIKLNPDYEFGFALRGLAKINSNQKESGCMDLNKAKVLGYSDAEELIKANCK